MKALLVKNQMLKAKTRMRRQLGYNLVEVMVAALILSTAILGIAGLQMVGMKGTHQSLMKQQAMGVVQNMIERMRANQAGVVAGNYTLDSTGFDCGQTLPNCSIANCNPAQIALMDQLNLVCGKYPGGGPNTGGVKITDATDNPILADGKLNITCRNCVVGDVTITIGWKEMAIADETTIADSLSLDTRIAAP